MMRTAFVAVAMTVAVMFAGANAASIDLDQTNFEDKVRAARPSAAAAAGTAGGEEPRGVGRRARHRRSRRIRFVVSPSARRRASVVLRA